MLENSFKNCIHFFKTRPPAVVFLSCLFVIMITTFTFTYYVGYSDKIVNSDAMQNWMSLSKHLSDSRLCIGSSSYKPKHNNQHLTEEISFVTLLSHNLTNLKIGAKVQAFFDLNDWHPNCPGDNNAYESSVVKVTFDIQKSANDSIPSKVCAIVEGPRLYLPEYSEPSCDFRSSDDTVIATTFYSILKGDQTFCTDDVRTKLSFDGKNNAHKFAIFLSENDKVIIYVHLIWFSYVLLFVIMVVLLYAIFHQNGEDLKSYRYT